MPLSQSFQVWIAGGQPEIKRPRRDLDVENTLTSGQWNRLTTVVQTATAHALGSELEAAALKVLGASASKDRRKAWKQKACRHFFQWLPEAEQDEVHPAASALRSGLMDQKAAEALGVDWEPPPQSDPAVPDVWLPSKEPLTGEDEGDFHVVNRSKLAKDIADSLLEQVGSSEDVVAVLALVRKKIARKFPDIMDASSLDCSHCDRVAPALATFRSQLSGKDLHSFDHTVTVAIDSNRTRVRRLGIAYIEREVAPSKKFRRSDQG